MESEMQAPAEVWVVDESAAGKARPGTGLQVLKAQLAGRGPMSQADVIAEVTKLASFDVRRLYNADGSPIPFHELDADTAACIVGVEVVENFQGTGKERAFVGYTKKYKVADKKGALEMLMKHLGLYEVDNKQKTDPLRELLAGLGGRSALPVVKDADA